MARGLTVRGRPLCELCSERADVKFACKKNTLSYCYSCYERLEQCYVCDESAGCTMPFTEYAKESKADEHAFQMEVAEERLRLEAEQKLELRRQRSVGSKEAVLDQWSANPNRQAQSKEQFQWEAVLGINLREVKNWALSHRLFCEILHGTDCNQRWRTFVFLDRSFFFILFIFLFFWYRLLSNPNWNRNYSLILWLIASAWSNIEPLIWNVCSCLFCELQHWSNCMFVLLDLVFCTVTDFLQPCHPCFFRM